jgi:hypothetical protein
LNDYNLQTAFQSKGFESIKADTIGIITDFSSMKSKKREVAVIIKDLSIYNGYRKDIKNWNNSIKVKDIAISYHNKCIGTATLANTAKMQWVDLGVNSISLFKGNVDTIKVIVKSVYPSSKKTTNYSLSELKLNGVRKY